MTDTTVEEVKPIEQKPLAKKKPNEENVSSEKLEHVSQNYSKVPVNKKQEQENKRARYSFIERQQKAEDVIRQQLRLIQYQEQIQPSKLIHLSPEQLENTVKELQKQLLQLQHTHSRNYELQRTVIQALSVIDTKLGRSSQPVDIQQQISQEAIDTLVKALVGEDKNFASLDKNKQAEI